MATEKLDKDKVKIFGDYLQLLGDKTVANLEERGGPLEELIKAHLITALGNFFQALSGFLTMEDKQSSRLDRIGGFLEVLGNALQILGEIVEIYRILVED